jgi:uncharacterized glyoxalase superfamily protein PhnB
MAAGGSFMKSVTPVMVVEEIEPCMEFWTKRLGFQVTAEVPDGNKLGFVILAKDGVQLMYQSWDSVKKDVPALAAGNLKGGISLYFVVENIDAVESQLDGVQKIIPRRETFYGATEVGVRDPAGYVMCFSEHK